MHKITLDLKDGRKSQILIGETLNNLTKYTDNKKLIILTDTNVFKYYSDKFPKEATVIQMPLGETNKSLATVEMVIGKLIDLGVDRDYFIVGVGGGIVTDTAGFIASVFMRGLKFGFVSTTLLAQVDASVGGKNGVNFNRYKNMVGVFNQPDFVICDISMLSTLPEKELRAGLAEVIKSGLLADKALFEYIEQNSADILNDKHILYMVKRCVEIKASVVSADEKERGERRKLNLGHTFGHAIEKNGTLLHGEAISIGMCITASMSEKLNLISTTNKSRIADLLKAVGLPTETNISKENLLKDIQRDKKKEGTKIFFVLNKEIGEVEVRSMNFDEIEAVF